MSSNWLRMALCTFAHERKPMYEITIQLGYEHGEITIKTDNYDVIEQINEFIQFQQPEDWQGTWTATDDFFWGVDEDEEEDEDKDDDIDGIDAFEDKDKSE